MRFRTIPQFAVALAIAALVACTPAAPTSPTAVQPAKAPQQATTPQSAAPKTETKSAAEREMDALVAAAKQEGRVAVTGPAGADAREALVEPFRQKYGVEVEFFGAASRDMTERVLTERRAGQHLWDVMVHGTSPTYDTLVPAGALQPVESAFLAPDVKDPGTWRGGPRFIGDGKQLFEMTFTRRGTLFVNPNLVKPDEFKSYRDLLDPKWKGKIVLDDPRKAGPGQATFVFFFLHPDLGPDFIRALGRQELTLMQDYPQEVDTVARGSYPVLIGTADFVVEEKMRQGVPIAIVDPNTLREGSDAGGSNGYLGLFDRAPHPNAAKLYINWLLSKEGQTGFARATGYVSKRLDVPTDHVLSFRIPPPTSIHTQDEKALQARKDIAPLLEEVFGKA